MSEAALREGLACGRPACPCARPGANTHCPAHDDLTPSMSVTARDGTLLVHCHAGCPQDAVVEALRARALWPAQGGGANPGARAWRRREWELRRADGELFATHCRIDYADGGRRVWWEPGGVRAVDAPLYRAEHIARLDPGVVVVVAEGEPDADALVAAGVEAVGTVTGAAGCPPAEALAGLRGRRVALWPDNDDVGRQHMDRVAARLRALGVEPLIVEWPEAPAKGGARDALERLGPEGVRALVGAAVPYPAAELTKDASDQRGMFLNTRRIADVEPEDVEWLAFPYVPRGKLTILEGDPGVGKSHVALALATAVSRGRGFPGMAEAAPGVALIMSAEDGLADTVRPRLDAMGADVSRVHAAEGPVILDDEGLLGLDVTLGEIRPDLVIIDPLVAYVGGNVDLHRANEVRAVTARLAELAGRYGCAIVCIRHLRKSDAGRAIYRGIGSIDFTAAARSVLLVGADPDDVSKRAVAQIKCNLTTLGRPVGFSLDERGFAWLPYTDLTADRMLAARGGEEPSEREEAKGFLLEILADGPMPSPEVRREAEAAGLAWRTVERVKRQLGIESVREHVPGGGRGRGRWLWVLPGAHEPVESFKTANPPYMAPLAVLNDSESKEGDLADPVGGLKQPEEPVEVGDL
ncbi:MAG: hypothetical protein Kow0010_10740 [Dehalococcoidia bacterium]